MRELFIQLIHELSPLLGTTSPRIVAGEPEAVHLRLDGIEFLVAHRHTPPGLLSICCKFGTLPDPPAAAELLRLLEINLAMATACAGALGVDSHTREVVYIFHAPLRGLSAHVLCEALGQAARQAQAWRNGELTPATSRTSAATANAATSATAAIPVPGSLA